MTFASHPDIDEEKLEQLLDCCERQHSKILELQEALKQKARCLELAEAETSELRERIERERSMRPSIEVLQRMANGLDPYDPGRFKAAVAALPHETPKLSATVAMFGGLGIGDRLDARKRERLRVIESEPEPTA
jgi:hypothetical protein